MYIIVGVLFIVFGLKTLFLNDILVFDLMFLIAGILVLIYKPKQSSKSDSFAELGDGRE